MSLVACGGDTPTDTERAATFQATVDGQAFVASERDFSLSAGRTRLSIFGLRQNLDGIVRQVSITVDGWQGPGRYALGSTAVEGSAFGFIVDRVGTAAATTEYFTTEADTGAVVITEFDPQARWVAGSFHYRARLTGGGTTVTVTAGHFAGPYFVDP